jgi:hypothetical protein
VSNDFEDSHGNVIRVTIRPPADRPVDIRLFDGFTIEDGGNGFQVSGSSSVGNSLKALPSQRRVIDVSDYEVEIEPVVFSDCFAQFKGGKDFEFRLGPGKRFVVKARTPEVDFGVAYPTVGDVDVFVISGQRQCGASIAPAGFLDYVGCYFLACQNANEQLRVEFRNRLASEPSYYVGVAAFVFVER